MLKSRQAAAHDAELRGPLFEHTSYQRYFHRLPFLAMQRMLATEGLTLDRHRVFVGGCGAGLGLEHLKDLYDAEYVVGDISAEAVGATLRRIPGLKGQVEDLEQLSFADASFEFAVAHEVLHHLPRPAVGLYELLRVSRRGVIAIEPNDSWLTRLATRLGLATEIEHTGNYVYRFSARDVERFGRALFSFYRVRRLFAIHHAGRNWVEFQLLRIANGLASRVVPGQGNYIVFYLAKSQPAA